MPAGPIFAVMAADLQEPPELVEEFFRSLAEEPVDIVLGVRSDRDDPLLSKTSANVFWSIYRRFVQRDMPPGGIDAFACNQQVRDALMTLNESNTSLVGQVLWLGFRRKHVPYRRLPRKEGKSGWTFRRKLRYMFDSIFAFTDLPLTLLMAVGTLGVLFSTIIGTAVFVAWCLGTITVPGYTPVVLADPHVDVLPTDGTGSDRGLRMARLRKHQAPPRLHSHVARVVSKAPTLPRTPTLAKMGLSLSP